MNIESLKGRILKINNLLYMKDNHLSLTIKPYDIDNVDITSKTNRNNLSNHTGFSGFFGDIESALMYLVGFEDAIKAVSKKY